MKTTRDSLESHRKEASESHDYFMDVTKKCKKEWTDNMDLEAKTTLTGEAATNTHIHTHTHSLSLFLTHTLSLSLSLSLSHTHTYTIVRTHTLHR